MADLPTNLKDDILDSSVNKRRRYQMIQNEDGTVEFEDVTEYSQVGDEYGAGLINETNKQVNARVEKAVVVRDLATIGAITQPGFIPDALAVKDVNDSLDDYKKYIPTFSTTGNIGQYLTNALSVYLSDVNNTHNQVGYVDTNSINIPDGLAFGVREVLYINSANIILRLTGADLYGTPFIALRTYFEGVWDGSWTVMKRIGIDT